MLKQVQHDEAGGRPFAIFFPWRPSRETKQGKVRAEARRRGGAFTALTLSLSKGVKTTTGQR